MMKVFYALCLLLAVTGTYTAGDESGDKGTAFEKDRAFAYTRYAGAAYCDNGPKDGLRYWDW